MPNSIMRVERAIVLLEAKGTLEGKCIARLARTALEDGLPIAKVDRMLQLATGLCVKRIKRAWEP